MGVKNNLAKLLPERWDSENLDIRVMLFTGLIVLPAVVMRPMLGLSDSIVFVLSGLVAILAVYWVPPTPKQSYIRWILTHLVLIGGASVSIFTIPRYLAAFVNERLAQFLCLLLYASVCWFVMRPSQKSVK